VEVSETSILLRKMGRIRQRPAVVASPPMPGARLQQAAGNEPAAAGEERSEPWSRRVSPAAAGLAAALLAVCLYAAFAHGAVAPTDEERLQLSLAVIALAAAVAWQWRGALSSRAPGVVWPALGLLVAFAFWSGITVLWSVAPDRTWAESNRALTYALVLVLAIMIGASLRRAIPRMSDALLVLCLSVTAYGLGQKLIPALHVSGVFSLDQAQILPRLQAPLGYWNALALVVAMGAPPALAVLVDEGRPDGIRLGAAGAIVTMLVTIGFTYSRGGVLALLVALVVMVTSSGAWLRCLMWLALPVIAAAPVLVIGLNSRSLTATGVALDARERAGGDLIVLLGACLVLLVLGGRRLLALERRTTIASARAARIGRALAGAAAIALVAAILAVAVSHRGLTGSASHAWDSFTATRTTSVSDPSRLLSADSENRWVWWKEAAGAFGDRPLQGWGAGSFAVVHLLYRRNTLSVQQPHSVPLQFLSETGVIGAVLGVGALALLLAAGWRTVRNRSVRNQAGERVAAAALLAVGAAYAVHALYDWDWDIPGVTIPALLALGVLGAGAASGRRPARADVRPSGRSWDIGRRVLATGVAAICLAAFAASVALPRIAAADAARALVDASSDRPASLTAALEQARRATRLDPLSDAGPRAAATIAIHRGHLAVARTDLLAAVRREPSDGQAWQELSFTDFLRRDYAESAAAARHALAVDPHGPKAQALALAAARHPASPSARHPAPPS
jgi:hypothetical protein